MEAGIQEQVAFYLTGRRPGDGLEPVDSLGLRPALLAGYRDLTRLRYDFPLVLVAGGAARLQSLSAIVDGVVREVAQGADGDRVAQQALRIERGIRAAVAAGATGSLASLWDEAVGRLAADGDDLQRLRAVLAVDGEVIDCAATTPARVLRHLWSGTEEDRAAHERAVIDRLILKLSDILRVDDAHSEAGRSPASLRAAVGTVHAEVFDFEAMSRLLGQSPATPLPARRRRRIEGLIAVLESQQFFPAPGETCGPRRYSFVFHDCDSALAAYRERLPRAIELARAMAIAELEIDSQYDESRHDALFAGFGATGLDSQETARFPNYLVCLNAEQIRGAERDTLMEMLAAGLPVKVLVQSDDLLDDAGRGGTARLAFGQHSRQITSAAIGLNDVFVLQASASHLYQVRERILAGLAGNGPALFSVFSGATGSTDGLPPYLVAAAAMESRAFPAFSYDPGAGDTWAERFSVAANPQAGLDWPVQHFRYEDAGRQRIETTIPFTLVDFVACDRRFAGHFASLARTTADSNLGSVDEYLGHTPNGTVERVPSILMVDGEDRLQRVVVDDVLIDATRRCRDAWHSLRELGGIHNSHAELLLAREREVWEAERRTTAVVEAAPTPTITPAATVATLVEAVAPVEEPADEPARSPDEAWIESERCTTCNECTLINPRMFAYDENRQSHIVDINAGTYRDLVEAAENCQVAIIHPGKPRNPNEPGLEDLLKRAEPFR